jgi:hypothetical protein
VTVPGHFLFIRIPPPAFAEDEEIFWKVVRRKDFTFSAPGSTLTHTHTHTHAVLRACFLHPCYAAVSLSLSRNTSPTAPPIPMNSLIYKGMYYYYIIIQSLYLKDFVTFARSLRARPPIPSIPQIALHRRLVSLNKLKFHTHTHLPPHSPTPTSLLSYRYSSRSAPHPLIIYNFFLIIH